MSYEAGLRKTCQMHIFLCMFSFAKALKSRISGAFPWQTKAGAVLVTCVVLAGCASTNDQLVLDPIGPAPGSTPAPGTQGELAVFTAFDPLPDLNRSPYRRRFTDYRIFSADGEHLVQVVNNNRETLLNSPPVINLSSGVYRVRARANGYGTITVPVVIQPGQLTTVHLEGSVWWPRSSTIFTSNPVRLPKGEIAGWRAQNSSQ